MSRGTVACYILTFNRPKSLPRAIRSVLGQTYRDLICVIVDDGSRPRPNLEEFDDPRLVLFSGPQRPPEDKRRLCTSSWALNRAQGLLVGCRWASYLTDLGTWFPDRLERMTAEWDRLEPSVLDLALLWGHQVHEGKEDTEPGRWDETFSPSELEQTLPRGNYIDLASVLESADAARHIPWDESPEAWPDPDRRRWLAHAKNGGWAIRVPVPSDVKRTSPMNAGRLLADGADPADLARMPRE